MELMDQKFSVRYDASTATIICKGIMDLRDIEGYKPVANLFSAVIDQEPQVITLDVTELEFLNSSGITTIGSGLVIKMRNKGRSKLVIQCNREFPWQERSMKGISRLMHGIELKFDRH